MSSILEESKKSRGGKKSWIIKIIIFLVICSASVSAYYFFKQDDKKEVVVEQKEWTVKKDDLKISIESDGKVVAEDGVELSFSVSGDNLEVKEVFINEGDKIKKGDKVATVKTETLELNVRNAYSNYLSTLAGYNEVMNGATEEQIADAKDSIALAEISLKQSKISLENVKQSNAERIQSIEDSIYDAEKRLKEAKEEVDDDNSDEISDKEIVEAYEELVDVIKAINISLSGILGDSDEIVGVDKEYLNDDFESLLGVKKADTLTDAKASYSEARKALDILDSMVILLNLNSSYSDIDMAGNQAILALHEFEKHLYDMKLMLEESITSNNFTQTDLDNFATKINTNRSIVNSKIASINTQNRAISNAKEDYSDAKNDIEDKNNEDIDNYNDAKRILDNLNRDLANIRLENQRNIENSEETLRNKELNLEQAKRNYNDLIAPLTESKKASERSKLTSSSISLEKARNELENATIISPIDGVVASLNYKTGDIILDNTNPVAVIINNDTLFIEVNIEETNIGKIKKGQTVYAVFDALDELKLKGEVTFISLTSKTDNSGIVTYLVRIMILNKGEVQIREGMTASVDFITAEVEDVLVVPVGAVKNVSNLPSVLNSNNEWIPVTTGFTDGKKVEVISGLKAGDKIVY